MTLGRGAEIHFNDGPSGFAGLIAFSKAMARDQRVSNPQGECNPVAVTCAANRDAVALNCDIERPVDHVVHPVPQTECSAPYSDPAASRPVANLLLPLGNAPILTGFLGFHLDCTANYGADAAPQMGDGPLKSFTFRSNPEPLPQQLGSGA